MSKLDAAGLAPDDPTRSSRAKKQAAGRLMIAVVAIIVLVGGGVLAGKVWLGKIDGVSALRTSSHPPAESAPSPTKPKIVSAPVETSTLCTEDKQFLWDVEHVAFVMEQKALPVLKQAIVEADRATLASFLAEGFEGSLPGGEWTTAHSDSVIEIRRRDPTAGARWAGATEFVDEVLAWRGLLDEGSRGCQAEIGLVRLSPQRRGEFAGPWSSLWRVRLAGRRDRALVEVSFRARLKLGPVGEDLGSRRGWIQSATVESLQAAKGKEPLFADVTDATGIATWQMHDNWRGTGKSPGGTGGVYLGDIDQDGNLDLLSTDVTYGFTLYCGTENGVFLDVTDQAGIPRMPPRPDVPGAHACLADLDGDGDEDIVLQANVYENIGGRRFRDVTSLCNLQIKDPSAIVVADYDRDGRIDLYETHHHAPSYRQAGQPPRKCAWIDGGFGYSNILWRNVGNWQFEDVTDRAGAAGNGGNAFTAVWLDVNNDQWPDILSINEFGCNALLINQRNGAFRQNEDLDPIFGGFSMGVAAGDYDNDGHTDIYVANMYSKAGNRILANVDRAAYPPTLYAKIAEATTGNKLYRGLGNGRFEVVAAEKALREIGWTYGPAFVDLNADGLLDIYSTAGFISYQRGKPDG
ncbi:MAG: VCBS repeat-containing protein [Planctomycetia bacterium]|nr:VCBS repeat-containing protein [Planctomycetia bacterium]